MHSSSIDWFIYPNFCFPSLFRYLFNIFVSTYYIFLIYLFKIDVFFQQTFIIIRKVLKNKGNKFCFSTLFIIINNNNNNNKQTSTLFYLNIEDNCFAIYFILFFCVASFVYMNDSKTCSKMIIANNICYIFACLFKNKNKRTIVVIFVHVCHDNLDFKPTTTTIIIMMMMMLITMMTIILDDDDDDDPHHNYNDDEYNQFFFIIHIIIHIYSLNEFLNF